MSTQRLSGSVNKPTTELSESQKDSPRYQFGISTLLILTVIVSMIAGYLRPLGQQGFAVVAVTTPLAVGIGLAIGKLFGELQSRLFWAVVTATIFQVITADVFMLRNWDHFVWPIFGAILAATISVPKEFKGLTRKVGHFNSTTRMLIGTVVGILCYLVYTLILMGIESQWAWHSSEFAAFAACGIFMAVVVESSNWLADKFRISSLHVAFGLVVLAIAFANIAPRLIPGW